MDLRYLTKLQNRFMHRSSNWLTIYSKTIHIQCTYLIFQYSIWQEIHAPKTRRLDWKSRKKGLYSWKQQHMKYVIYSIGVLRLGQLISAVRLKTPSVYKISCCIKQKWKITIPHKCEKGNSIHLRYFPRKKVLLWAQRWARNRDAPTGSAEATGRGFNDGKASVPDLRSTYCLGQGRGIKESVQNWAHSLCYLVLWQQKNDCYSCT